jgi:ABC-type transport system involved in Fe-S cluster assembly fused permease/ATPase subunit
MEEVFSVLSVPREEVFSVLSVPRLHSENHLQLRDMKTEYHAITNKYPETASVVQQIYKTLSAGRTWAKVGEKSEWNYIVNSAEERRANLTKL